MNVGANICNYIGVEEVKDHGPPCEATGCMVLGAYLKASIAAVLYGCCGHNHTGRFLRLKTFPGTHFRVGQPTTQKANQN